MALGLAKIPPFPSPPGGETQYLSKFDDLVPTTPVLSLQNVGPYNGLDFQLRTSRLLRLNLTWLGLALDGGQMTR